MRSACFRERLTGLLYAPAHLLDLDSPALRRLTFDVFTTDKSFFGMKPARKMSPWVERAMRLQKGPRLARAVDKVEDIQLLAKLNNIVDRIKFDYL